MPARDRGILNKILIFCTTKDVPVPIHGVTTEGFGVEHDSDVPVYIAFLLCYFLSQSQSGFHKLIRNVVMTQMLER